MTFSTRLAAGPLFGLLAVLLGSVCGPAWAEEKTPEPSDNPEQAQDQKDSRWQIIFGSTNLYPRLEESEERIDRMVNNGLGRLFPRWEKPTTFRDWRNKGMLWDLQIGVSYELTPKANLFAVAGGAEGKIPYSENYWLLGRPIKVKLEFERTEILAATGIDYYPWGQPELPERKGQENTVWRRIRAAKPYFEAATGYLSVKEGGTTDLERPLLGRIFHFDDEQRYDVFFVSPRVGIDIPLSERNSLSYMVGPSFFTSHKDEFDSFSFYSVFRHRF